MKLSQRKICQAVILAASVMAASAAMAATPTLIDGGSSLVAPSIKAEGAIFPTADGTFSYTTTNSTTGQTAFLTNNSALYGLTGAVDFGNSDAALTTAQVTSYDAGLGATDGPLIQLPYVTTPITIPLTNPPTGTGPALPGSTTPTVALNDNDLCGIFSGKITNWSGVAVPGTTSFYAAGPITVVYRSDGSGTTDLLTRHLAAVCSTSTNSNVTFLETLTFASNFPSGVPSNFIGESGSGGVAAELVTVLSSAGTHAVSYLSPDYTNTFLAPSSSSAATDNLAVASLVNATLGGTAITPTAANAALAISTFAPPSTATTAADATQWVPNAANPTTGYPISGTTNIIASQCYANPNSTSPTPTAAVIDFLTAHYENSANAAIIAGNGFATVPSNYLTAIKADFLSNTSGFKLNIGNASVCGALAGR